SSEIVAALPPDAKGKPPKQPTQRPRQSRNDNHAAEVLDLIQRRLFGVADHLRKIADAAGRRILDHARQNSRLAVIDAIDREHGDAGGVFVKMRPRPLEKNTPELWQLLRREGESLAEQRDPRRARRAGIARC